MSFSALSKTTLAILSNSEHTPSIRLTPPFSSSVPNMERKPTTRFISRTSDLALGSCGFWRIFPNNVTRADTGKYKISLGRSANGWRQRKVLLTKRRQNRLEGCI